MEAAKRIVAKPEARVYRPFCVRSVSKLPSHLATPMLGRLKFWLTIGLLVSNLAVGVLSLYVLRSVNRRYSQLIERSVPALNNLRTLSRELSTVQRLARRIVDPDNERSWADLLPQMDDTSNLALNHGRDLARAEAFSETNLPANLVRLAREYDAGVDQFLAHARNRQFSDANRFNTETLRPLYERYQDALDEAAQHVQSSGRDLRDRTDEDARFFGSLLLAFAGWPLFAAVAAVLVMGVMIAGLVLSVFAPGLMDRKSGAGSTPSNP